MQNCGVMAKPILAICCFCLFTVDVRQTVRPYSNLLCPVAIQARPYHFIRAVLPSTVCPQRHFSTIPGFPTLPASDLTGFLTLPAFQPYWLPDLTEGIRHKSCRRINSRDSVMYGCGIQTSIQ